MVSASRSDSRNRGAKNTRSGIVEPANDAWTATPSADAVTPMLSSWRFRVAWISTASVVPGGDDDSTGRTVTGTRRRPRRRSAV